MRGLIERDRLVEGVWTGYSSALDRSVLKKSRFLQDDGVCPLPDGRGSVGSGVTGERGVAPQPKRTPEPSSPFASKLKDALKG
jgi:hypothetical protein